MANEVSALEMCATTKISGTSRLLREEGPRKGPAGGIERVRETIGFSQELRSGRRWNWLGHVLRMEENRAVRKILLSCVNPTPESIFGDVPILDANDRSMIN